MLVRYNCPKCHIASDIEIKEYAEVCEYSDIGTCRPSWAKVHFKKMVCPVCKEETEIETDRKDLKRKPKKVDRICI